MVNAAARSAPARKLGRHALPRAAANSSIRKPGWRQRRCNPAPKAGILERRAISKAEVAAAGPAHPLPPPVPIGHRNRPGNTATSAEAAAAPITMPMPVSPKPGEGQPLLPPRLPRLQSRPRNRPAAGLCLSESAASRAGAIDTTASRSQSTAGFCCLRPSALHPQRWLPRAVQQQAAVAQCVPRFSVIGSPPG